MHTTAQSGSEHPPKHHTSLLENRYLPQQSRERKAAAGRPQALIVIAGSVNYFYNTFGERIAEALRNLGAAVDVATLKTFEPRDYDCCFLVGLGEIVAGHADKPMTLRRLAEIHACSKFTAVWNFESMATRWFIQTQNILRQMKFDVLIDTNIHDQHWLVPDELRAQHHFVFFGLTRREVELIRGNRLRRQEEGCRHIPWVMVGHATEDRAALAERLVREVHPSGFLYLSRLSPVTEESPHLNERQYQSVLRRSQFHVWCSHHETFYAEGERFRISALCGGVPIKVYRQPPPPELVVPFSCFMLPEADFSSRLRAMDFSTVMGLFLDEFESLPLLESELVRLFEELHADGRLDVDLMSLEKETP